MNRPPVILYGTGDVAQWLGVSRAAVSNFLARHDDTPEPFAVTPDGRRFYSASSRAQWVRWHRRIQARLTV